MSRETQVSVNLSDNTMDMVAEAELVKIAERIDNMKNLFMNEILGVFTGQIYTLATSKMFLKTSYFFYKS